MRIFLLSLSLLFLSGCNATQMQTQLEEEKKLQEISLGQKLFFDTLLSKNGNQSCSTCHNPEHGFVDTRDNGVNGAASLGDDLKSIGDRNAPTASYAMFSPSFHYDVKKKAYVGGEFLDGRAHTLKAQAGGPPTNPIEMAIPSKVFMAQRLKNDVIYNATFKKIYGDAIFKDPEKTYEKMTQAIALFESTKEFAPFDSKYDRYLNDEYDLSPLEDLGRTLFFSNNNNNCASCHVLKKEDAARETFTNYRYHNIGVPSNHALMKKNVVDANTFIDHGLLNNPAITDKKYDGKFKVPTLRNIAVTGPYMHNGVFAKLSTVVEFYDKYVNKERTLNPETGKKWVDAEVKVGKEDIKLLRETKALSEKKVKALVAFMNLLTDKKYEHLIKENN
ncbi:MAG: cytochrome c peroxidase [Sulfurimonas sp.]|nr:cytochrome c peroxidase [Sulfurimonas sp.]MDQ7060788.1 cytochrome c peroxidase [Sulfurimonas sp.]